MDYSIRENSNGTYTLLRHGIPHAVDGGRPSNAELEFWLEIQSLREENEELKAQLNAVRPDRGVADARQKS